MYTIAQIAIRNDFDNGGQRCAYARERMVFADNRKGKSYGLAHVSWPKPGTRLISLPRVPVDIPAFTYPVASTLLQYAFTR